MDRYAHHRCRKPGRHALLAQVTRWGWMLPGALYLIPKLVYASTQSGAWAFVSIALSLTVGNVTITALAHGRCQPPARRRTVHPLLSLAHVTWALRKDV